MANVTLKYRGPLHEELNITEEITFGDDIADILKFINNLYGKEIYKIAKSMLIAVNGESILKRQVFKTKLYDGDIVSFLPVSGGG